MRNKLWFCGLKAIWISSNCARIDTNVSIIHGKKPWTKHQPSSISSTNIIQHQPNINQPSTKSQPKVNQKSTKSQPKVNQPSINMNRSEIVKKCLHGSHQIHAPFIVSLSISTHQYLVGGFDMFQPLWTILVSWDDDIPNWIKKSVLNHRPDIVYIYINPNMSPFSYGSPMVFPMVFLGDLNHHRNTITATPHRRL